MTNPRAFCFYKEFPAEPEKEIQFDRHYLLYAAKGAMRFETADKTWVLPPSRAAWIAADKPIKMHCMQPITCCSVLFATDFIECPTDSCRVFEMTPLAREMILHCQQWGPETSVLPRHAEQFFASLAHICVDQAQNPSETWVPSGQSVLVKRAISFTRSHIATETSFEDVAKSAGASPRNLARRFSEETGHTWRQLQRRMRMIAAVEYLAEDAKTITEIALDVGYGSSSAFNTAFKEFFDKTPAEYRRQSQ